MCVCVYVQSLSHVWVFETPWTPPTRLLCPWSSPGKNTGVGCHFFFQGIFPTQGSKLQLLLWQVNSPPLHYLRSPSKVKHNSKFRRSWVACYSGSCMYKCVCLCVCVWERERKKKKTVMGNKIEKSVWGQLVIGLKWFPSDFMLDLVESKTSSKC